MSKKWLEPKWLEPKWLSLQFAWPHIHEFFALPSRRSPELRQPCFSSPCFAWLTGIELHGTLSRARRCLCLQASNCLSQEEHCSRVGLLPAEGHLHVAHGSGIIECARRVRQAPAAGRTPQLSSSRTDLPVQQSVPLLASLVGPLCSRSLCPSRPSTRFGPRLSLLGTPLGSSIVVHHLYPRISADRENFSTLHGASVDEDDFAFRGFSEAIAICQQPPSRPSTGSRGLLAGWLRGFSLLSLHLVWSSGRNFRLVFGSSSLLSRKAQIASRKR